jgi:nucleotide sugar dehydrogenase
MKVAVVGLGKMGLPLACVYAGETNQVIGCDIAPTVVDAVNRGQVLVGGEPGLEERVQSLVAAGRLSASTDTTLAVRECDVVVLIPPLKLTADGQPDYSSLDLASSAVAAGLRPGTVVVYETTLAVGDTRRRFLPILEAGSRLSGGNDFYLAFSPERVFMGRVFKDLATYPKIVGGINPESTDRARTFYGSVLSTEVIGVQNSETAEFIKLAETTYRDVNIALANELGWAATEAGIDSVHAFQLANTQPYSHLHMPGAGVGGHCIPVYPRLLLSVFDDLRVPKVAREINDSMPSALVNLAIDTLAGVAGKNISVLGLSYRGDVKEATLSPTWDVTRLLAAKGAGVALSDPWFTEDELRATGCRVFNGSPEGDATIILAKHAAFEFLDYSNGGVVLDGRPDGWKPKLASGQPYFAIGRGWDPRPGA